MKVFVCTDTDKEFFKEYFDVEIIDMKDFNKAIKDNLYEECIFCNKNHKFNMTALQIRQFIEKYRDKSDIIYLNRYLDRCDKNIEIGKFEDYKVYTSYSYGSNVIYFSEKSIEKLKHVNDMNYVYYSSENINIDCITTFPLIAEFIPTKALSNNEMVKQCLCREVEEKKECCASGCHSYGVFWFIIALIIILALFFFLFDCITCEDFKSCERQCYFAGINFTYS